MNEPDMFGLFTSLPPLNRYSPTAIHTYPSIHISMSSRKSFYFSSTSFSSSSTKQQQLDELAKIEQEITLTLQQIDKNLSRSNTIINDDILPTISAFGNNSRTIWNNVGFWKTFFENAANVQITTEYPNVNSNNNSNNNNNNNNNNENENVDEFTEMASSFIQDPKTMEINNRYKENLSLVSTEDDNETSNSFSLLKEDKPATRKRLLSSTPNKRKPKAQKQSKENDNETESLINQDNSFMTYSIPEQLKSDDLEREQAEEAALLVANDNENDERTTSSIFDLDTLKMQSHKLQKATSKLLNKPTKWNLKSNNNDGDSTVTNTTTTDIVQKLSPVKVGRRKQQLPTETPNKGLTISQKYDSSPFDYTPPGLHTLQNTAKLQNSIKRKSKSVEKDNEEEEEDNTTQRFPKSPKYGSRGKLLRSTKGQQIALDYARSSTVSTIRNNNASVTTDLSINGGVDDDYTGESSSFRTAPLINVSKISNRKALDQIQQQSENVKISEKYNSDDDDDETGFGKLVPEMEPINNVTTANSNKNLNSSPIASPSTVTDTVEGSKMMVDDETDQDNFGGLKEGEENPFLE